jgi:MFS family permease
LADPDVNQAARAAPHTGWAIAAHALVRIASSAEGVLVGLYLASLGNQFGTVQTGLVGSLGAASYAAELVASVPLGLAADVLSVRLLMVCGALAAAIGVQLFAVTVSRPLLFLSQLLQGIGVAGVTPPLLKFLTQATTGSPARRARAMSLFELSMLAGLALGGLVAAELWAHVHAGAFTAVASLNVACALLLVMRVGRVPKPQTGRVLQGLREALSDAMVRGLAPAWICVNAIIGLWLGPTLSFLLTHRPRGGQYLDGLFAASPSKVGYLMLAYTAVFAVGVTLWSMILPRIRLLTALRISLVVMFAVCAALFAVNHSEHWSGAARATVLSITALMIMVESGFTPAALSLLAQSLEPVSGKGAAMGIYSFLLGLGAAIGSLMAGALGAAWQIDGLLLGTVLLAAVALILLRGVGRRTSTLAAPGPSPA